MGFNVEIRKNMPVAYVLENGTQEQKAVIKMFDYDSNGIIDGREAKAYNKYGLRSFGQENTVHVINIINIQLYQKGICLDCPSL